MKKTKSLFIVVVASALSACIPSHLQKYRKDTASDKRSAQSRSDMLTPGVSEPVGTSGGRDRSKEGLRAGDNKEAPLRASIYAVDKQTYRFTLREPDVWDSVLNVLMRNYNLTIVDRNSGIVTTEWDTFYLNNAVYRNKISVRVFKSAWNSVDVTLHNNVERLRDASQAGGTVGAVWLPSDDPANEVVRVIQNMALVMNQPPPSLPPNVAVNKGGYLPEPGAAKQ